MAEITSFLKSLLSAPGLSAYETPVMRLIEARWRPLVDKLSLSRLGSLHGLQRGSAPEPRPSILVAAHMDAIGLMVTQIVDGFLRITQVGEVDARILPGQLVTVHGMEDLPGLVVQPPAQLLPASVGEGPLAIEYLFVDVGLPAGRVPDLVHVGDPISFATQPIELSGETLCGHTLDNRASIAALTICLKELRLRPHAWDVWAAATVQEETGLIGAYTSAYQIRPQLAVAVDVTFAKGPGVAERDAIWLGKDPHIDEWKTFPLGGGPTLGYGPNIHPALHQAFKEAADRQGIPYGVDIMPGHSGTDAFALQVTAEGIPSMLIGIPLRYMHTPVEVASIKDIQHAGQLLAEFIAGLQPDFNEKIVWDDTK